LNIPLYPTQLYSSLSGFVIFLVLILMHTRKKFEGQVFLWLLVLHSTARLFVERFRGDDRGVLLGGGDMSITQLVTLLILIASIVALFIFKRRQGKN